MPELAHPREGALELEDDGEESDGTDDDEDTSSQQDPKCKKTWNWVVKDVPSQSEFNPSPLAPSGLAVYLQKVRCQCS